MSQESLEIIHSILQYGEHLQIPNMKCHNKRKNILAIPGHVSSAKGHYWLS
jgi:hypothetical protein